MFIKNTQRINEKIAMVHDYHLLSGNINGQLTHLINENHIFPSDDDIQILRKEANEAIEYMKKHGEKQYTVEHSILIIFLRNILESVLPSEQVPDEVFEYYMDKIIVESRLFTLDEMNNNPYIKDLDFKGATQDDFEFRYEECVPYELQIYDVPKRIDEFFADIPRVCCFPEKYKYPVIFQKSIKSTWMSVSPNEIFTVEEHINLARGKVLTLGCGMGYFAYMASLKEEVSSITIIEREESVIKLFETFILPQFKHKEKIEIIKADAIKYMKSIEDGEFDYCFADIWIGVNDLVPYFAIKEIGRKLSKTKISYWIEDAFAILLEYYVYLELINEFLRANGEMVPEFYQNKEEKRIKTYIHKLFENEEISKPEHIDFYLNPNNILKLIEQTELIF